jgi:hypothetical protein
VGVDDARGLDSRPFGGSRRLLVPGTSMFKYASGRSTVVFTSSRRVVAVAVALAVAAVVVGSVAGTSSTLPEDDEDSGVMNVTVTGAGAATVEADTQFVWRNARTDVVATVVDYVRESDSRYDSYWVRLTRDGERTFRPSVDDSIATEEVTLRELERRNVTLPVPSGELSTGTHELHVSMYEPSAGADVRVNSTTFTVRVVHRSGDVDGDGLRNAEEVEYGTELLDEDTDEDGLRDGVEVHVFGSDPTVVDTDDDGVDDDNEVQNASAPRLQDTDDDSLADLTEILNETSPSAADSDLDGLPDPIERELGTDPNERDTDGDGLADMVEVGIYESDPTVVDSDGDGLDDAAEVQRFGTDPADRDTDGDGIPDGREVLRGTDPTEPNNVASALEVLFGGLTPAQELGTELARALTPLPEGVP